jgi:hypothetical protein
MTLNRWAALFGILAAVFIIASVLISGDTPDGDAPDDEWVQYIEDDDVAIMIRAYLLIAAGISVVALYSLGLYPRISGPGAVDGALARLGAGAAVMAAASMSLAGLIGAAVAGAEMFGDVAVDASTARLFDNWMYGGLLVGAGVPMGAVMAIVAIQARRRHAFPGWLLWISVLGVLGMAASLIFVPFVLLPVWLIAVAIALFRAADPA